MRAAVKLQLTLVDVDLFHSQVARFRRVNEDRKCVHHDALELPSGKDVLLTRLLVGQRATVLQLPVAELEKEAERRPVAQPTTP